MQGTSQLRDLQSMARLNNSGLQPVLFIHGLWLEPSSWSRWVQLFEDEGYAAASLSWPFDPEDVATSTLNEGGPSETLLQVVDSLASTIKVLDLPPVLIGHSFGGLLAQLLASRGLAAATIAIAPAAFRGVLPLPVSALRSAFPVLRNPANRHRRVPLTLDQFSYAFANAVDPIEAQELYERFAVPAPGGPLFEAAFANLNPWTTDRIDLATQDRRPMLMISGQQDRTVPPAVVEAEFKLQKGNQAPTEYRSIADRGHSLVIDHGWREVALIALEFAHRFVPARIADRQLDEAEEESFPASDPAAL